MDYREVNDYELIYRIRENSDEDSINVLIKKYEPIIIKCANKYFLRVKQQGVDMNDLIQEGRIAVVKALNSYNPDSSLFYTYVIICIDRHMITFCRNLNAIKHSPLNCSVSDDCLYFYKDNSLEPFNCLENIFEYNVMRDFQYSLDFIDSNIFELRINGFSYKEISDLLDISLSAVSRRLCKIKKLYKYKKTNVN